jgi:hypothetical protein
MSDSYLGCDQEYTIELSVEAGEEDDDDDEEEGAMDEDKEEED